MTSCRDVDRLATLYVDAELDERRSSAVRGHLRVCTRCAERVEDEARLRELSADLEPIDPPPAMWNAIDARLAEAEIGDSHRPALWLWFQSALDAARRNALFLGLGGAAAAVLLFVLLRGGADEPVGVAGGAPPARAPSAPPSGTERDTPPVGPACAAARSHDEQVLCQTHESDRRYLDAIAELTRALADERAFWSPADAARFDAALADLSRAAEVERVRLAGQPLAAAPASRDPLYAIYQAQIELLSSAVVAGDPIGAVARRGTP